MDPQIFMDISLHQLEGMAKDYKERGWRFVNLCASTVDDKVELLCTFSNHEELENLRFFVEEGEVVPAMSPLFPNAFMFENETHDLYGITFKGCIIDFGGKFYSPSVPTPMNPNSAAATEFSAAGEEV